MNFKSQPYFTPPPPPPSSCYSAIIKYRSTSETLWVWFQITSITQVTQTSWFPSTYKCYSTVVWRSPIFLAPGSGFVEDNCPMNLGWGGNDSGSNASNGEWQGEACLLTHLSLTSGCAASVLLVHSLGVRDPFCSLFSVQ